MLKTASSTLSRIAWLRIAASGTDTFGSPSVCGDTGSTASASAAATAPAPDCSPARPPRPARSRAADAGVPHVHRHRLRPADERRAADHREQRKQHRADRIGVHDRVERHAAEQPRRRIAQPIGRPRMRHFVHRQREQQHDERDEDLREVDVQQEVSKGYERDREARLADSRKTQGRHRPFSRRQRPPAPRASRAARPPGCRTSSAASAAAAARCRARGRAPIADRASSARGDGTSRRSGAPRRECAESAAAPDRWRASAIGSSRSRVKSSSSFFAMPTATRFASPSSSSAAYAADSCPLPPSIRIRSGNGPPCSSSLR